MITAMLLAAAVQAAPAPPAATDDRKVVVREIIIHEDRDSATAEGEKGEKGERREIVIVREGKDGTVVRLPGHGERRSFVMLRDGKDIPKEGEKREIHVIRSGSGPHAAHGALIADCKDGRRFETEAAGGKDGDKGRTKVMLCTRGDKGPGDMTEALERAAKRISENKDMPADVRARVLGSLNDEIARLKTGK